MSRSKQAECGVLVNVDHGPSTSTGQILEVAHMPDDAYATSCIVQLWAA
jgi:hypothetical protein